MSDIYLDTLSNVTLSKVIWPHLRFALSPPARRRRGIRCAAAYHSAARPSRVFFETPHLP